MRSHQPLMRSSHQPREGALDLPWMPARAHRDAARACGCVPPSRRQQQQLEALAAETVAPNRKMARREASVYADGPMPEETRPRRFRRKPSVTSTPWR